MSRSRRKTLVAVAVTLAAALVVGTQFVMAQGPGAYKLEGAWVARVVSYNGVTPFPAPYTPQWSYVLSPDPSGRRASLQGSVDIGFTPPGANEYTSPLIGEAVSTGPDTATVMSIWYHINKATGQILDIGTARSESRALEPGKAEVTHYFAIYPPTADTDHDGIPDTGAPVQEFIVVSHDTRVGF